MIKIGATYKAKGFEGSDGYKVKILSREGNGYRAQFIGPIAIQKHLPKIIEVVSEKYLRERYHINEPKQVRKQN